MEILSDFFHKLFKSSKLILKDEPITITTEKLFCLNGDHKINSLVNFIGLLGFKTEILNIPELDAFYLEATWDPKSRVWI